MEKERYKKFKNKKIGLEEGGIDEAGDRNSIRLISHVVKLCGGFRV